MNRKNKWVIFAFIGLIWSPLAKSQDSIVHYSFYQITSAWHLNATDTIDISEKFNEDYFFAFFVEDNTGNEFFTIKNYEGDQTMCIGGIKYDFTDTDKDYHVDFYSTDI